MTWHAGSMRVRVWLQLRLAPLNAQEARHRLQGANGRYVDHALYQLKREGFAEQRGDGRYQLTGSMPPLPPGADAPHADQAAAVELIEDCPAGIDESVLSFELKVSPRRVQALLAEPIAQQRVRRAELSGGIVRYLPTEAAA